MEHLHLFQMKGTKLAIDGAGGAVHLLDDLSWEILQGRKSGQTLPELVGYLKWPTQEIQQAWDEIWQMEKAGLLYGDDAPWRNWKPGPISFKALCLNVAHSCNMACKYCFATTVEDLMPLEVGIKAIDWLVAKSGSRVQLEIDFFGGEPLLNWSVVQGLVKYSRSIVDKKFTFTLTTNGLLLSADKMEYLNDQNIGVVLSIDGRPAVHNKMRPTVAGNFSTYERIVPGFLQLAQSRNHKNYYARGTYTSANLDFSQDIIHLAQLGFKQISLEPVVLTGELALKEEHLPILYDEYEKIVDILLEYHSKGQPINFFHFQVDLFQGPCVHKRLTGCGAGYEYLAVTPTGDFYPCHQFIGRPEFRMGTVHSLDIHEPLTKEFQNAHLFHKENCPSCWARFYCGGGCHANAHLFNGNIHKPYEMGCKLHKKRLECSFYLQSQLR